MKIDLRALLKDFERANDREGDYAFFQTNVPWVAPFAYLNIIFKPAAERALQNARLQLRMPESVVDFLRIQNGGILFSGAISIYGVHAPGQLLNRSDPFARLPFDIEQLNQALSTDSVSKYFVFAAYGFDDSNVCIGREDGRIYLCRRDKLLLQPIPGYCWNNLEEWITSEIHRLSTFFDPWGKRVGDESLTLPQSAGQA